MINPVRTWLQDILTRVVIAALIAVLAIAIVFFFRQAPERQVSEEDKQKILALTAQRNELRAQLKHAQAKIAKQNVKIETAKEAQAEASAEKVDVWSIASIHNRTVLKIPFQLFFDHEKSASNYTLEPERSMVFYRQAKNISIAFDASLRDGYQEKHYSLHSTNVIDREPNEQDERRAPVHYFSMPNDKDIELHLAD